MGNLIKALYDHVLLNVKEVAQVLRVSENSVRNWCRSGELPAMRIGREYKIAREDLERWMQSRYVNNTEAVTSD